MLNTNEKYVAKANRNPEQTCCILRYGSRVFEYLAEDQKDRLHLPNPLCTLFPTVTRSTYMLF